MIIQNSRKLKKIKIVKRIVHVTLSLFILPYIYTLYIHSCIFSLKYRHVFHSVAINTSIMVTNKLRIVQFDILKIALRY